MKKGKKWVRDCPFLAIINKTVQEWFVIIRVLVLIVFFFPFFQSCSGTYHPPLATDGLNGRIDFSSLNAKVIPVRTLEVITRAKTQYKRILRLGSVSPTMHNTLLALDNLQNELWRFGSPMYLMAYTHPSADVRKAGLKCIADLEKFSNRIFLSKRLYRVFLKFSQTSEGRSLTGEYKRALQDILKSMRKNGLALSDSKLKQVRKIRNMLTKCGMDFSNNIRNSGGELHLNTTDQIAGLSERYLKARKNKDGGYTVDLTYPSFFPFLRHARWAKGRKKLLTMYYQRAMKKNVPLLRKILRLRKRLTALLGFKNYASYVLVDRMAKNPDTVWQFINDLKVKLAPLAERDLKLLSKFKQQETGNSKADLKIWDVFYYSARAREKLFSLKTADIRPYFPVSGVIQGLFRISQTLFGVEFREVSSPSVWHKDVKLFEAFDRKTGALIGRFYMDLYPRKGKYGHAAMFGIFPGKQMGPDIRQLPAFALVCNFPRGTEDQPGLLSFDEVETFFHEFGHGLHDLLSTTKLQMFSGTSVQRDFVETPSQFYENWIYIPSVLRSFARHYKTGKSIPMKIVNALIRSRSFLGGYLNTKQLFYATYDMTLNDRYDPDAGTSTSLVYKKMHNRMTGLKLISGTAPEAAFGHLIGYAAGYYGYLWSKVYAQDLFSPFLKRGVDPVLGMKYRRIILANGGSVDPMILLKRFLGRTPQNRAFLKTIGLNK